MQTQKQVKQVKHAPRKPPDLALLEYKGTNADAKASKASKAYTSRATLLALLEYKGTNADAKASKASKACTSRAACTLRCWVHALLALLGGCMLYLLY